MLRARFLVASLVLATGLAISGLVRADIVFFVNNPAGFAAANAGNTSLGVETFEENNAVDPTGVNDPLTLGVPNGPFLAGLLVPLTVQANVDGGSSTGPNPRGVAGMALVPQTLLGNPTDIIVANNLGDSLDLIFSASDRVAGVGFNSISVFGGGTINVQVFDLGGALLGSQSIAANEQGNNFLGFVTGGGDLIGRVNIFDPGAGFEGGDNIQLFSAPIPEPSTAVFLLPVVAAAGVRRARPVRSN